MIVYTHYYVYASNINSYNISIRSKSNITNSKSATESPNSAPGCSPKQHPTPPLVSAWTRPNRALGYPPGNVRSYPGTRDVSPGKAQPCPGMFALTMPAYGLGRPPQKGPIADCWSVCWPASVAYWCLCWPVSGAYWSSCWLTFISACWHVVTC